MLGMVANVSTRPLLIIRRWKLPVDWMKASIALIFKKDKENNPENYRRISLALISRKLLEQILLETTYEGQETDCE